MRMHTTILGTLGLGIIAACAAACAAPVPREEMSESQSAPLSTTTTTVSCQGSACYDTLAFIETIIVTSPRLRENLNTLYTELAVAPMTRMSFWVNVDGTMHGNVEREDGSNAGVEFNANTGRVDPTLSGYLNPDVPGSTGRSASYNQYRFDGPWNKCTTRQCYHE
jgi:hypothetical protein